MRTTVLLSACLALVASTTGLLLAIHINIAEHSADHDSHDCTVCRQLSILSRKFALTPSVELVQATPVLYSRVPGFTESVETRHFRISQPCGPPAHTHPSQSEGLSISCTTGNKATATRTGPSTSTAGAPPSARKAHGISRAAMPIPPPPWDIYLCRPMSCVWISEAPDTESFRLADHIHPETWEGSPDYAKRFIAWDRRQGTSHYLFADGHAEGLQFEQTCEYPGLCNWYPEAAPKWPENP